MTTLLQQFPRLREHCKQNCSPTEQLRFHMIGQQLRCLAKGLQFFTPRASCFASALLASAGACAGPLAIQSSFVSASVLRSACRGVSFPSGLFLRTYCIWVLLVMPLMLQSVLLCSLVAAGVVAGAPQLNQRGAVLASAVTPDVEAGCRMWSGVCLVFAACAFSWQADASHMELLREAAEVLLPRVEAGGETAV